MVDHLAKAYAEHRVGLGLLEAGHLLEVFVAQSVSWTIVVTVPGRGACISAAGSDWESLPARSARGLGT